MHLSKVIFSIVNLFLLISSRKDRLNKRAKYTLSGLTTSDIIWLGNGVAIATGEYLEVDEDVMKAFKKSLGPKVADCFLKAPPYPESISTLAKTATDVESDLTDNNAPTTDQSDDEAESWVEEAISWGKGIYEKIKTTISNFVEKIKTFWNYCEPIYKCVKKAIDEY